MQDMPNRHRRPDKVAKKYYFAPDVVQLIEDEALRTGYSRNVVLEIMVRERLGRPAVEEAIAAEPPKPKRERPAKKPRPTFDPFAN